MRSLRHRAHETANSHLRARQTLRRRCGRGSVRDKSARHRYRFHSARSPTGPGLCANKYTDKSHPHRATAATHRDKNPAARSGYTARADRRSQDLRSSGCRATVSPRSSRPQIPPANVADRDLHCEGSMCRDARLLAARRSKTFARGQGGAGQSARARGVRDRKEPPQYSSIVFAPPALEYGAHVAGCPGVICAH